MATETRYPDTLAPNALRGLRRPLPAAPQGRRRHRGDHRCPCQTRHGRRLRAASGGRVRGPPRHPHRRDGRPRRRLPPRCRQRRRRATSCPISRRRPRRTSTPWLDAALLVAVVRSARMRRSVRRADSDRRAMEAAWARHWRSFSGSPTSHRRGSRSRLHADRRRCRATGAGR